MEYEIDTLDLVAGLGTDLSAIRAPGLFGEASGSDRQLGLIIPDEEPICGLWRTGWDSNPR